MLIVGAGGLGCPLALYLAAAGIGTIGVVDDDAVELSNLQRQLGHATSRIGMPKVDSLATATQALNPACAIEPHATRLTAANALDLVRRYDLVCDASDNFPDPLPAQRCLRPGWPHPRFRRGAALRRPVVDLRAGRPLLSLPLCRAAAGWPGAKLRRGRRAGVGGSA